MKYQYQAIPGGPVETFSDRPLVEGGIKRPIFWACSNWYRKHVQEQNRRFGCPIESTRASYLAFIKEKHEHGSDGESITYIRAT